jgi:hypothetical protein
MNYQEIKRSFVSLFLVLLVMLFAAPNILHSMDFVFFLSGNYAGGMEVGDSTYSRVKKYYTWTAVDDSGSITSSSVSSFAGGQVGAQLFFTPNIGISLSANFCLKKPEFDLNSSYTYRDSENTTWTGTGDMQVTPINLNVVFTAPLFSQMNLNITAGGTYFITKLNMNTNIGYGELFVIDYGDWQLVYIDWYVLELENNHSKNFFGGNIGLDLEYKLSPQIGLFIGFQYLFAPKQTFDWALVQKSEYESGSGDEPMIGDPDIGTISSEVNFSHYTAGIGIKVHI